jgi:hypothetical protein
MWLKYACTKYQRRARGVGSGNSDVEMNSSSTNAAEEIASMRRNNGDAVVQDVEGMTKSFVG